MGEIFNQILYRPIFNFLVLIYNLIPGADFGISIIFLTTLIRLVFMPLSVKSLRSQKILSQLQPKIKEIQERHKTDKVAQSQATMALYKEYKVNPVAGCLPLLIQLPVLLALYRAFANGFKPESLKLLYGFISNPGVINSISFGFFDLAKNSPFLAVLAGIFQFVHSKINLSGQEQKGLQTTSGAGDFSTAISASGKKVQGSPTTSHLPKLESEVVIPLKSDKQRTVTRETMFGEAISASGRQMLYFFPVMIIIIGWRLPAGLVLYWAVTTLFSVFEQIYINKTVRVS